MILKAGSTIGACKKSKSKYSANTDLRKLKEYTGHPIILKVSSAIDDLILANSQHCSDKLMKFIEKLNNHRFKWSYAIVRR